MTVQRLEMAAVALLAGTLAGFAAEATRPAASQPVGRPPTTATSRPAGVVQFQPNVRIDYGLGRVEVDGQVVMREGPLELFACSPNTREYESIVRLDAQPLVVFQALGLLGLEPGHPLRIDPETGRIIPPDGDPLEIDVRYDDRGTPKTVPIESWMRRSDTREVLDRQVWVFAGSFPTRNKTIAADEEGTIVAVVDFESAVVALPRLHTAANSELWLEPNTPAIPDVKSPCTVIFRPGPVRIRLDSTGRLYLGSKPTTFGQTARKLRDLVQTRPQTFVDVEIAPDAAPRHREQLRTMLSTMRIDYRERTASRPAETAPADGSSDAADPNAVPRWLLARLGRDAGRPSTRPSTDVNNASN